MAKLCCISVTLAARLIGIFDLSASILAINFIAAEFLSGVKQLSAFNGMEIFTELIWAKTSQLGLNRSLILICTMVYTVLHFICSAVLVLATLTRKKALTMPWLTLEIINLANMASAVAVKMYQNFTCSCVTATSDAAYDLPVTSLHLLLAAYFWLIVFSAKESWLTGSSDVFLESKESAVVEWFSSPKTPVTVTADNYSVLKSPEAPIA